MKRRTHQIIGCVVSILLLLLLLQHSIDSSIEFTILLTVFFGAHMLLVDGNVSEVDGGKATERRNNESK